MPLLKRTRADILSDNFQAFLEQGNSAVRVTGTPENVTANMVATEIAALYNSLEFLQDGLTWSTATAGDLDRLGELVGLSRSLSQVPSDESSLNVKFFVDSRYDGDATDLATELGLGSLTIPAGTEVSNGSGKNYYTISDVTFGDSLDEEDNPSYKFVFANVRAYTTGESANVNSGELNTHNLSAHITLGAIASNILVTNLLPINNGTDIESDQDFRFRISQAFTASAAGNQVAILQAARAVPGVAEAFVIPNVYGTGTFGVSIDASIPIISPGIISAVQGAVDAAKAAGTRAFVLYPEYLGLRVNFEVIFNSLSDEDKAAVTGNLKLAAIDYINNLGRGETLAINKLLGTVTASTNVKNAQIASMSAGTFNPLTQAITNATTLVNVDQTLSANQKWFSSTTLIDICEVE